MNRIFRTTAAIKDDPESTTFICAVLLLPDNRLLMADLNNKALKVTTLTDSAPVTSIPLPHPPRRLALLADGRIAVNTDSKVILFLAQDLSVASQISTGRQYVGLQEGIEPGTLLVSTWESEDGPASLDVIRATDGSILKTIVNGKQHPDLKKPCQMLIHQGTIFVPDLEQDCLFKLNPSVAGAVEKWTHPDLKKPTEIILGKNGELYLACFEGQCLLARKPGGDSWRHLLRGKEDGEGATQPWAIIRQNSRLVVSWMKDYSSSFQVVAYELE